MAVLEYEFALALFIVITYFASYMSWLSVIEKSAIRTFAEIALWIISFGMFISMEHEPWLIYASVSICASVNSTPKYFSANNKLKSESQVFSRFIAFVLLRFILSFFGFDEWKLSWGM